MSDGTTPGTEGEANPGAAGAAATGSAATPPSGDGSGSQSSTGTPGEDQVAQIEARRRALQSENDRLKNELAAAKAGQAKTDDQGPAPFSEDRIIALLRREREMTRAESTLREQYKLADPEVYERDYPSPEALTVAVQNSHDRIAALVGQGASERESQLLARYVEKYGELDQTPPDANGGNPTGDPTVAQIEAMDFLEMDRYEAEHPGVIERVMRSVKEF